MLLLQVYQNRLFLQQISTLLPLRRISPGFLYPGNTLPAFQTSPAAVLHIAVWLPASSVPWQLPVLPLSRYHPPGRSRGNKSYGCPCILAIFFNIGLSHNKREPSGSLLFSALRAVRLRPTSFRNSLYTLISNNIFFVFPYISASRFLLPAFLSFSTANNIYGINPCLSLCFSV